MSYKFPNYLKYADTHEYVKEENGCLKIGVSEFAIDQLGDCLLYTSPSPRDRYISRMPSSA